LLAIEPRNKIVLAVQLELQVLAFYEKRGLSGLGCKENLAQDSKLIIIKKTKIKIYPNMPMA
jgi:hypothetical protein